MAPFFHHACTSQLGMQCMVVFVNLGGVGNITLVDGSKQSPEGPDTLLAFDTGPANMWINDLVKSQRGLDCDKDGTTAAQRQVYTDILEQVFEDNYFSALTPKSLDRNNFSELGLVEIHRVRMIVTPMYITASKLVSVFHDHMAIRLNSLSF